MHAVKRKGFKALNAILALFIALAGVGFTGVQPANAAPALSAPASQRQVNTTGFVDICGSSCVVSGYTSETLKTEITLATSGSGYLKLSSTSGITTAPAGYTTAEWTGSTSVKIGFIANQTTTNTILSGLQYKSLVGSSTRTVNIATSVYTANEAYNSATGHFYEVITSSNISWENARCRAKWGDTSSYAGGVFSYSDDKCTNKTTRRSKYGMRGYLANITSLDEHKFLQSYMTAGTQGWIGGSDYTGDANDGIWRWFDGPESGQVFYVQTVRGAYTSLSSQRVDKVIDGRTMFNYFSDGEPNGAGGGENFAEFGFGSAGVGASWNDCQNACNRSYFIIEYGDTGDTLAGLASNSITVVTASGPTASSTAAPTASPSSLVPGTVLTSAVTFTGYPTPTKAVTWQRSSDGTNWTTISGATSSSYTLTRADVGSFIRTYETGTVTVDSQVVGTATTASSATTKVGLSTLGLAPDLNTSSDTGANTTDNKTADNTPTLDFTGVTEGATVTVTATKASSSNVTCTTSAAGAGGTASCTLGTLADGIWSLTATQNLNSQTSSASSALSLTVKTANPTVTDTVLSPDTSTPGKINVTFTFSENVVENDSTKIWLSPGWTPSVITFSGNQATFYITKTLSGAETVTVSALAGLAKDDVSNTTLVGTGVSESVSNLAPTASLAPTTSFASGYTNASTITYDLEFDRRVWDLDASDITSAS